MNAKPTALDAYLARTAAIHAKLVEMFPDRDPAKMLTTVNNRVPTYLNKIMGMGVVRDSVAGGYYIPESAAV